MNWTGLFALLICSVLASAEDISLCKKCRCGEGVVDCNGLELTRQFNGSEWTTDMQITEVKFDNNSLVYVRKFPTLTLTRLSFRHNKIIKIEDAAFKNLTNLTELDLSYNSLTYDNLKESVFKGNFLPDEYQPLHSLHILNLGSNALHTLHPDVFEHTPNIKVLILESNPIKFISSEMVTAMGNLPVLEVLDLSYAELTDLPENMLHTRKSIKYLNLTGNEMVKVPDALKHGKALEVLHLSENPIAVIDANSFEEELPNLRELHMSNMPELTYITAGALSKLTSLQELYLGHNNHLTSIHSKALSSLGDNGVMHWPPIVRLDLGHNNLPRVEKDLLENWRVLKYLNLEGNPWMCDCESQWMVTGLLPQVQKLLYNDSLKCVEPEEMRGRKLVDLEVRNYHMRCLDADGNHPEKDAKLLVGMLVGVLIAIPLTLAALFLFRKTRFGASFFSRGPADYSRAFYSRADTGDN